MVANREAIVLDSANNVFVGPNGYFKVVIDSFDGTAVQAWHVEDPKGNKTGNLAGSARGRNIDLLLTRSNRTVAHFIGRLTNRFLGESEAAQAAILKLQADLEKVTAERDAALKAAPKP